MSETDFEESGVCRQCFRMISWRNGKRRWMPLPKWLKALQGKRARFARFPGQIRLRRRWNLHFQFLKQVCRKRWPNTDTATLFGEGSVSRHRHDIAVYAVRHDSGIHNWQQWKGTRHLVILYVQPYHSSTTRSTNIIVRKRAPIKPGWDLHGNEKFGSREATTWHHSRVERTPIPK